MPLALQPLSPRIQRRLILAAVIVVLAFLLLGLYWKATASQLQARLAEWVQAEAASGAKLSFDPIEVSGFPFSIDLDARNVMFERGDAYRLTAPHLRLHIRPWSPFRPVIISDEKATLAFPRDNAAHSIDRFSLRIVRPWATPHSYRDIGLFIYANLDGINLDPGLKPALGNNIPSVDFAARIMGEVPDVLSHDSVEAWRVSGGIINFDRLEIDWPPIDLKGDGTLALDKTLQPIAALNATMSGYKETVDRLRDEGQIKPFAAALFKAALSLLENKKTPKGQPRTITAPVTIQNNGLFLAGINLAIWQPLVLPFNNNAQTPPGALPPGVAPLTKPSAVTPVEPAPIVETVQPPAPTPLVTLPSPAPLPAPAVQPAP